MASPAALAGNNPPITKKNLADALYASGGIISMVATHFGVSRTAIYNRINRSTELQKAQQDAIEAVTDLAGSQHIQAIKAGYYSAILFHLKTKGRSRGYNAVAETNNDDSQGFILEIKEITPISSKENALKGHTELTSILEDRY